MEQAITGNGTVAFFLRGGIWIYELSGTVDTATVVALKHGPAADGSDHVPATDADGVAIQHTGAATPEPVPVTGGSYMSIVTTDYDASANLIAHFRRSRE